MASSVKPADLVALQGDESHVRNLCVLAHVDHGKTTLTDNLIVSNGIISQRLAGRIRYMDSRPDEAQRGITMKSSAISLVYRPRDGAAPFLINVIDSPGHVDFSSEVSTAVRVTDGALVVVDVVEGVCIQTEAVLRQARQEGVTPVLVLNKMDRLVTELNYTPAEAYGHLHGVLTAVNAACALLWREDAEGLTADGGSGNDEEFFSPIKGNVVFASSGHGWAFGLDHFARLFEAKLGMRSDVLMRTLWGDFFLTSKKTVTTKQNADNSLVPMFASLCLKQVWDVYAAASSRDTEKLDKIFAVLGLTVPPRDLRTQDQHFFISSIFSRWMPLSEAVLSMAVAHLPSPRQSQQRRVRLLCSALSPHASAPVVAEHAALLEAVAKCDPNGPTIAFISKIFPSDDPGALVHAQRRVQQAMDHLASATKPGEEGASADAHQLATTAVSPFVGFCRIFSGTLKIGDKVWLLGPRYDPAHPERYVHAVEVEQLYLLMGRALEPLKQVTAGNVFGIGGVSHLVLKTATLSSSLACTPFSVMPTASHPIVRVAVEPKHSYQLAQLATGLDLLNQADPCVQVSVTDAGEHLLTAAGEMHLELCLRDLRERYAKIDVEASAPIVPFRESISNEPGRNPELKVGAATTADHQVTITVQARALPANVTAFLDKNRDRIDVLLDSPDFAQDDVFRSGLEREMSAAGSRWLNLLPYLWSLGPRGVGCNMLFNRIEEYADTAAWQATKTLRFQWISATGTDADTLARPLDDAVRARNAALLDLDGTIQSGFQLAASRGPLCEEPMMGVCFVVVNAQVTPIEGAGAHGPLSGQMITCVRDACRSAFLSKAARLYEATYVCDVRTSEKFLGKVSTVLGRRRAEDYDTDHSVITLRSRLPVRESFGLYQEMLSETSGGASIQLKLHGWTLLDMDPFFVPKSNADLEDYGDNVGSIGSNLARELLDEARRRKGLPVEEKLVVAAEKQRTLSKKK